MKRTDMNESTVLVIGGTSGIGYAIAHAFQHAGARLAIVGKTPSKVDAAVLSLSESGSTVEGFVADVTDSKALKQLIGSVIETLGHIDVLVNSQGTTVLKPAEEVTEDEYDLLMHTNLRSMFFACTEVGKHMLTRGKGSIVNIASLAAHRGWPNASVYSISKHGVIGLTKSLAAEWATQGIRVNAISPGFFLTELNQAKMSEERKRNALLRTPLNRFGQPDETAEAAVFLSSDDARFITGTVLNIDGGYLAGGI
jgi:NAD(P)-dependent dehydrogenase (short-subunit alcohol dehydrogenase family)